MTCLKAPKKTVLILVHPGSACGSAIANLGSQLAHSYREGLIRDLSKWTGDMLVIDGELSEELKDRAFRDLGRAIEGTLGRCRAAGHRARRSWGCDNIPPHQADRIQAWLKDGTLNPQTMRISLTGAWYNEEGGGCVGGVEQDLLKAGFEVEVRDSVVCELRPELDNSEDNDFEEPDATPSP